jgi:hypothetical protein
MVAIILLLALLALGVAAYTGRTTDSRSADYTLGPVPELHPWADSHRHTGASH